jgi:hypothetical protein
MATPRNRDLEDKLLRLFRDEKLRSKDDLLTLFCRHLGFEYAETPLPAHGEEYWGEGQVAELAEKESFEILVQSGDAKLGGFAIIYGTLRDFNFSNQRAIIYQLRKVFPDALYVFAKPQSLGRAGGAQVNIVHARLRALGNDGTVATRLILRRFRFGPGERYRTASERLAKLDLGTLKSRSAAAITALCNEAFDKEALTSEFFKKLDQYIKAIESDLREHQQMSGPEAFSEAQLLIERLIFLYFAQNRGWLDQKSDYLLERFAEHRAKPKAFTFYGDFLHRLFRTLAEPDWGNRLAGIPFLNGGLFNDDDFKPESSKLKISNATFADIFDDLLEGYNFTVREDTPLSQEVAVDPEMLGKVFESIVLHAESAGEEYQAPDKRKATGSYYTPRIVVHFICRESLRLYFAQRAESLADAAHTNTWTERTGRLFEQVDSTDGFSEDELKTLKTLLSPSEAKRCLECLRAMRTLDPAVGSGAFPVGLLHEVVSLQRIFETATRGYRDPVKGAGTQWMQQAKEYFIQHSLFGVDIQQQAIEICRLRLWLSLLVDYELGVDPFEADRAEFIKAITKISQLPNLEMNFKRGDSLHDFICGHPVRIEPQKPSQYTADLERIEKLGAKLHKTTRGKTKKGLRLEILEKRIALARRIVGDQIQTLTDQSFDLGTDFFGGSLSDNEKRKRIDEEVQRLNNALKQLERDEVNLRKLEQHQFDKHFYRKLRELEGCELDGPLNFAWRIDFPHVLSGTPTTTLRGELAFVNEAQRQQELLNPESRVSNPKSNGGFDLVVGNPPFVTARNATKRELYRERWPRVCYKEFQLVCPFIQMSFALLRAGGQLGFIVSNAFAMREFGKPLLEDFLPTVHLQKIVNCDGLSFPGHGTPTCLILARTPSEASDTAWKDTPIRVATRLPGGGDLLALPEESPLWHALATHHNSPGYRDGRIAVTDRVRAEVLKWPLNFDSSAEVTKREIERNAPDRLKDFVSDVGYSVLTKSDDIFFVPLHLARIHAIEMDLLQAVSMGDELKNWSASDSLVAICPYNGDFKAININRFAHSKSFLFPFRPILDSVITFGKTKSQSGRQWFEYFDPYSDRHSMRVFIAYADIATHNHFVVFSGHRLLKDTAPLVMVQSEDDAPVVAGLLNSSLVLFWLKQVCFNKGAGEDEHRDRFEFATKKVRQIPLPPFAAEAFGGQRNATAERLSSLARACWRRGQELPRLAMKQLFEKPGEAYYAWNSSLPGHVQPHKEAAVPFSSTVELRQRLDSAQEVRETLRREMIAQQEEMDWLVYEAYGLIESEKRIADCGELKDEDLTLEREERPFRLWAKAAGDFAKALALIPASWPAHKKKLWRARIEAILDNEHIRRIEQPVYKRRWDEQWKVGNRWECGLLAYAQEFIDAFTWWLSEKAEWHLEHEADGGPIALPDWSAAVFKDLRVAAAWPVVANAVYEVEKYKFDALNDEKKETRREPERNDAYTAFEQLFREIMLEQSVAQGIPPAVPWDQLAAKKKWTPTQLKKAQAVRGKLNVSRERFQQVRSTYFVRAE